MTATEATLDDPVLAAVAAFRKDVCGHLHRLEADGITRDQFQALKDEVHALGVRLGITHSQVESVTAHDLDRRLKIEREVASVQTRLGDLHATVVELRAETEQQSKDLKIIAASLSELVSAGKRIWANPVFRTFVTSVGLTLGIIGSSRGCTLQPPLRTADPPAATIAMPVPALAPTGLTALERDLAACLGSKACEESVHRRHDPPARP